MNSSKIIVYDEQYRILLLDPGSSRQQIITAWKHEIDIHHPDRFPDSKRKQRGEKRTKRLNVAKDELVKYWDDFGKPPPDRLTLANIDHQEQVKSLNEAHSGDIEFIKRDYEKQLDSLKRELAAAKTKATASPTAATSYVTNFNISLTHNIANSGSIGMNLHINFEIVNACGMNTCIKARFYYTNMTLIKAKPNPTSQYIDNEGYLAVFQNNIPEYQHNRCSIVMFIPYSEFSIPIGRQIELISKIFVLQGVNTQAVLSLIAESPPVRFWIRISEDPQLSRKASETYANGNRYDGEFLGNKKNGRGVYTWPNGYRYDGEFRDDVRNGHGVMTFPNGERYDGEYRDDKQNGHGVSTFPNGERYDGEFRDGKWNGHGVYTWPDGRRYDGEWRDDKKNGHGVLTFLNGERYDGEWCDDEPTGKLL